MPRKQSTAAQRARAAGGKYTEALRTERGHQAAAPPVLMPIVRSWCEPDCDATPHPGAVCRTWSPIVDGQASVPGQFDVCQAADLPYGRTTSLIRRFDSKLHDHDSGVRLLKLVYAMLLEEQPRLAPDPRKLREYVEAGDMAGVDWVMQPLDRAAVALTVHDADHWWDVVYPRLNAFAERTLSQPDEAAFRNVTVLERRHATCTLAKRWLKSQQETRNWDGYMERESILWMEMQPALQAVLTEQAGGFSRGEHVRVDGKRMTVAASIWGSSGQPVAYQVVPVTSSGWILDWARVDADDIEADARI